MHYFLHSLEELLVIVFADLMKLQLWSGHRVSKWCCFDVVRFVMTFREMEIGMIVVFCILMDRWSCLGVGEALNASSPVSCVGETKPSAAFLGALCWQGSWLKKRSRAVAWEGWQKLGKPCSRRKTWIFVDLRERTQWRRKDRAEVKWGRPVLDEIRTWKTRPSWKGNEQRHFEVEGVKDVTLVTVVSVLWGGEDRKMRTWSEFKDLEELLGSLVPHLWHGWEAYKAACRGLENGNKWKCQHL